MSLWMLVLFTLTEVLLLAVVLVFFRRLRKTEAELDAFQKRQEAFLAKIHFNTELEQELMESFAERQQELVALDQTLDQRAKELKTLIKQAEDAARSPATMRNAVLEGHKRGKTVRDLARSTGMSIDQVELIIMESK